MARARKRNSELSPHANVSSGLSPAPAALTLAGGSADSGAAGISGVAPAVSVSNIAAEVGLRSNHGIAGSIHRASGSAAIGGAYNGPLGRDSVRGWHSGGVAAVSGGSNGRSAAKAPGNAARTGGKTAATRRGETREDLAARVAKNLILARASLNVTQEELAGKSGVARATIAQIEAGASDARVGTLHDLAGALKISPLLFLIRANDITSIARWVNRSALAHVLDNLQPAELERMNRLRETGLRKDLVRVAKVGVAAAESAGFNSPAAIAGAGIGSTVAPGLGTAIGALLGAALDPDHEQQASLLEGGEGI